MTKYRLDFASMATGTAPSDLFVWRQNNGAGAAADIIAGGTQGKRLRTNATGVGTKVLAYTPLNDVNDVETLVNFTYQRDAGKQGIMALRYGGSTEATTTGYALSGSFINNAGQLAVDEGGTGYLSWGPWNYLPNISYWIRFRVVGNTMKAKIWTNGNAEPTEWHLDFVNNVRATGSYNGFHQYNTGYIYYDYVSFGTNGDFAPRADQPLVEINYAELRRFDGTNFVQKPYKTMKDGSLITDRAKILVDGQWRIIK